MGKLTFEAKTDILRLLDEHKTNPEIVEHVNKEYNIGISEQYISRIRNRVNYYLIAHNTGALAKLMKKRNMLEKESLDAHTYAMHTVKHYLKNNIEDFSPGNVKISLETIKVIKDLYEMMEHKNQGTGNIEQNIKLAAETE